MVKLSIEPVRYKAPRAFTHHGGIKFRNHMPGASDKQVPITRAQWVAVFRDYITLRFEFERIHWGSYFPDADSYEAQLTELADNAAMECSFDLNHAATRTFWLEYLSEDVARVDAWRRFQRINGPCHMLCHEQK